MSVAPFYIYRHIRPDTNEVFYIGKGSKFNKIRGEYHRAYSNKHRSGMWLNIVAKNNGVFNVDILFDCETEQQCNEKEKEFNKKFKDISNHVMSMDDSTAFSELSRLLDREQSEINH